MNLRKRKKLEKRLGCKTYYGCRRKKIGIIAQRAINKWNEEHSDREYTEHIVYILDSKKGDLRHVQKLSVFFDVYPTSVNNSVTDTTDDKTITFGCPVYTGDSLSREMSNHL